MMVHYVTTVNRWKKVRLCHPDGRVDGTTVPNKEGQSVDCPKCLLWYQRHIDGRNRRAHGLDAPSVGGGEFAVLHLDKEVLAGLFVDYRVRRWPRRRSRRY